MAYTTIDDPAQYFNTVLYTGNGGTQSITGVGFQPDWVWCKGRSDADAPHIYDSVRGEGKRIRSDSTSAEADYTSSNIGLNSFDSDGFSIGDSATLNRSSSTYVSWNWKEDATAGFDIVSYTGNATARTISHSLSAVPHWMIVKPRESSSEGWSVYHHKIASDPETDVLRLDETNAVFDNSGYWNDTAPTSSVFSVGSDSATNHNGGGIIAYLWSEKKGFSKFGSYTGNGNADGIFVYTGFKPAWLLYRRSDDSTGRNWQIYDNKRSTFNELNKRLRADTNDAETTSTGIDFTSNGFKLRTSDGNYNASGAKYIYMTFAESPFVNSNGVPTNAR